MTDVPPSPGHLIALIAADVGTLAGVLRRHDEHLARTLGQSQARWQVMGAVAYEPRTVPQIARHLGGTRQAVQRLANLLVREGTAEFRPNPDHRGSPHLALTERGRAILARLTRAAQRHHQAIAASIDRQTLRDIHAGLGRLIASVERRVPDTADSEGL